MIFEIEWTEFAKEWLEEYLLFVKENWGERKKKSTLSKIAEKLHLISVNPNLYPIYNSSKNARRIVVDYNLSIFYSVKSDKIQILTCVWNRHNSQNYFV